MGWLNPVYLRVEPTGTAAGHDSPPSDIQDPSLASSLPRAVGWLNPDYLRVVPTGTAAGHDSPHRTRCRLSLSLGKRVPCRVIHAPEATSLLVLVVGHLTGGRQTKEGWVRAILPRSSPGWVRAILR